MPTAVLPRYSKHSVLWVSFPSQTKSAFIDIHHKPVAEAKFLSMMHCSLIEANYGISESTKSQIKNNSHQFTSMSQTLRAPQTFMESLCSMLNFFIERSLAARQALTSHCYICKLHHGISQFDNEILCGRFSFKGVTPNTQTSGKGNRLQELSDQTKKLP